jgi:hypothetical protein
MVINYPGYCPHTASLWQAGDDPHTADWVGVPPGTTTLTCTAKDENGRTDSCTVLMRVLP